MQGAGKRIAELLGINVLGLASGHDPKVIAFPVLRPTQCEATRMPA
jgi:hypothetical protein